MKLVRVRVRALVLVLHGAGAGAAAAEAAGAAAPAAGAAAPAAGAAAAEAAGAAAPAAPAAGVAAPAAGLHFSKSLMKRFEIKGVKFAEVTLHVGLGSFRLVEVEDLTKHKMDSEQIFVPEAACDIVNAAKTEKRRICAVGTTSMRSIESSVSTAGDLKPYEGWTNKFIFPPYDFAVANCMITNFHVPESTLLMMAAGFGGYDLIMEAYQIAIKEKYNFSSYGDCMFII